MRGASWLRFAGRRAQQVPAPSVVQGGWVLAAHPSNPPSPAPTRWPAGYALAVFIPISCVCVVPSEIARWVLVGVATLTSGTFIMLSLRA